jgi:hypothetical protein
VILHPVDVVLAGAANGNRCIPHGGGARGDAAIGVLPHTDEVDRLKRRAMRHGCASNGCEEERHACDAVVGGGRHHVVIVTVDSDPNMARNEISTEISTEIQSRTKKAFFGSVRCSVPPSS